MPRRKAKSTTHDSRFLFWVMVAAAAFAIYFFLIFITRFQCANSISCIHDLSGNFVPNAREAEFHGEILTPPLLAENGREEGVVLGEKTGSNKRIEVDLTNQKLYAFDENTVIYEFPISSGKWGKTPTGDFRIWIKLRYTRMTGGNKALGTYYNLPNVPYTMFFYNDEVPKSQGFGIHGAYWHNNFGQPMSHGCINMREEDVKKIYDWATPVSNSFTTYASEEDPGTPIKIYGTAPN